MSDNVADAVKDYWGFAVFLLTGVFGWILGAERQKWNIGQIARRQDQLEKAAEKKYAEIDAKLAAIQLGSNEDSIHIAELRTEIRFLLEEIKNVRNDLSRYKEINK